MTIYINLLSNFRIYLDSNSSSPAFSTLSDEIAERNGTKQQRKTRDFEARRISESPSDLTLVGEELPGYPQWIAGVGDIAGFDGVVDKPRRSIARYEIQKSYITALQSRNTANHTSAETTRQGSGESLQNNKRTALQRHCGFWDTDNDGLIYPWDIYQGFRRLGFHFALCLWAAVTIAICASYNTRTSYIPHPLFAINLNNINSNRHGSSTGTYDMDGELDEKRFEAIFQKYTRGKDYLTLWSMYNVWRNQRCGLDFFGWFAGGLEWIAMYILLWPEDGVMEKEEVRGVFDGSIFYRIAEQRAKARVS